MRMLHRLSLLRSPACWLLGALLAGCAAPGLPPPAGFEAGVAAPQWRVGERWEFQVRDGYNGSLVRRYGEVVTAVSPTGVTLRADGAPQPAALRLSPAGNAIAGARVRSGLPVGFAPEYPGLAFPLVPGQGWDARYEIDDPVTRQRIGARVIARVEGWERVRVPAGEFDALRITRQFWLDDEEFWRWGTRGLEVDWYAPAAGRVVRHEERSEAVEKSGRWPNNIRRNDWSIVELIGHQRAP